MVAGVNAFRLRCVFVTACVAASCAVGAERGINTVPFANIIFRCIQRRVIQQLGLDGLIKFQRCQLKNTICHDDLGINSLADNLSLFLLKHQFGDLCMTCEKRTVSGTARRSKRRSGSLMLVPSHQLLPGYQIGCNLPSAPLSAVVPEGLSPQTYQARQKILPRPCPRLCGATLQNKFRLTGRENLSQNTCPSHYSRNRGRLSSVSEWFPNLKSKSWSLTA